MSYCLTGQFRILILAVLFVLSIAVTAADTRLQSEKKPASGTIIRDIPEMISRSNRYLFYLHGKIVEDKGLRPKSPRFGVYEYEAIFKSLAAKGFIVISEPRERGTETSVYARKVVAQIQSLIGRGVAPELISVIGFSKGGGIAIAASTLLQNSRVNFVFLAACGSWVFRTENPLNLSGRILSIRELSDGIVGSCQKAFEISTGISEAREIELNLGGGHGVFFRPIPQWLDPAVAWLPNPGGRSSPE